jgi:hypothetical protein
MRIINQITFNLAYEMSPSCRFGISRFIKEASEDEYIWFTHYAFFHSSPKFGTDFKNNNGSYQYGYISHLVYTKCYKCGHIPDRSGICGLAHMFLNKQSFNKKGRLTIWCRECVPGTDFSNRSTLIQQKQFKLF